MSSPHLIGRIIDPIYAMAIGAGAAAVRIRREEKEKGRTTEETIASLKRRINIAMEQSSASATPAGKTG